MSEEVQKVRLNGFKWPIVVGLATLMLQLGVFVWGASALNSRVITVETSLPLVSLKVEELSDTMIIQGQSIAVMGEQINNIDKNVERLLSK